MTLLRQDAEGGRPPTHVLTLTSRDAVTSSSAYRDACRLFWRAFRKRYGAGVQYCGFIEWTTGTGERSGGHRRMHSHWLVKGLDETHDVGTVERWASVKWRELTGAWIVQFARLEHAGGVVGYLALHHEKLEQAPPPGWSGMRFRPSRGYFDRPVSELRELARLWLREHRWKREGLTEGAMLAESLKPAPTVVWGRCEWEKAAAETVAEPGPRFDTLASIRANEKRLLLRAQLDALELDEDRYYRLLVDARRSEAARARAARTGGGLAPPARAP